MLETWNELSLIKVTFKKIWSNELVLDMMKRQYHAIDLEIEKKSPNETIH
jgi:hypothetical protein